MFKVSVGKASILAGCLSLLVACMAPSSAPQRSKNSPSSKGEVDKDEGEATKPSQRAGAADESGSPSTGLPDGGAGPGATCIADGQPFDPGTMRKHLEYLASPALEGRAPGTAGDVAARKFIEDRFRCLGLEPGGAEGSYQQPFKNRGGVSTANVVGVVRGSDPTVGSDIIVVGAHHDHFGTEGGEGMRLGANDNASGVTGVLALAQAVKQQATPPRRTIVFMTFGSEETLEVEPYVEGSAFYVANPLPAVPLNRVVYMINFDMIGTYSDTDELLAMGTFPKTPATAIVNELARQSDMDITLGEVGGEGDSDFYSFCKSGVPFVGFYTDDPECYHEACDTVEHIDFPHLSSIAKLASDLTLRLANSTQDLAGWRRQAAFRDLGCF